jgi:hypothetical protein
LRDIPQQTPGSEQGVQTLLIFLYPTSHTQIPKVFICALSLGGLVQGVQAGALDGQTFGAETIQVHLVGDNSDKSHVYQATVQLLFCVQLLGLVVVVEDDI